MKYRVLLILGFGLILQSCQKVNRPQKPKNLIPNEVMVDVLVDLAKIDAARNFNTDKFDEAGGHKAKQLLLGKYGIDSLQLVESSVYYAQRLEMNDSIYSRVKNRLKAENDSLMKVKNGERDTEKEDKNLKDLESEA